MDDRENWPKWSPYTKIYDPLQCGSIDGTDTIPHDRALIRAMEAKFVPPHSTVTTPNSEKTLFIGQLDHKTTEETLKHEFSRYGTVSHFRIVKDVLTGFSRGYAFIQFKHQEDAERARRDAHHTILNGREILVDWENGRTMPGWVPRRLGGGFGGKKESGQLRFGGRDRPFRKPIIINMMRKDRSQANSTEENTSVVKEEVEDVEESGRRPARDPDFGKRNNPKDRLSEQSSSRRNYNAHWNRKDPNDFKGFPGKSQNRRDRYERKDYYEKDQRSSTSSRGRKEEEHVGYFNKTSKDQEDDEEDDRYFSKTLRDHREDDKGRDDRKYSSKSSKDRRNRNEWEEKNRRYSSKPSRYLKGQNEWEDSSERGEDDRKYPSKFLKDDRGRKERNEDNIVYSTKSSKDLFERNEWEDEREEDKKYSTPSASRDVCEDEESYYRKKYNKSERRSKDRGDSDCWEDTPTKEVGRSKDKDHEDDFPERSDRIKKRSRKSRDENSEDDKKKAKKKKKHSKKSKYCEGSDDSFERKSEKRKKRSKKSTRDKSDVES